MNVALKLVGAAPPFIDGGLREASALAERIAAVRAAADRA